MKNTSVALKQDPQDQSLKDLILINDLKPKLPPRQCNLCKENFRPHSKLDRFCPRCRSESELYHFAEWLQAA